MKTPVTLEQAILYTILYADIFEYPLTEQEVQRYLIGKKSSLQEVRETLQILVAHKGSLIQCGPYYLLPGREAIVQTRLLRLQESALLWPKAVRYGNFIARIPFIRMVALTGSLAMRNADPGSDLDYLVVTRPDRLWLARSLVILLVRFAASNGDRICPNYFLSENALALPERNIYSAHELAQMALISGEKMYFKMRQENPWVEKYLPNAGGLPGQARLSEETHPLLQSIGESLLDNPVGSFLDRWEMRRKVNKFTSLSLAHPEACFGPDWCKGHIDDHEGHTLQNFTERIKFIERIPA